MIIKIVNWKEHQPKDKLVNPWWFKWHNAIALNVKFLPLKQREICALVYILSICSEANSPTAEISWEHLQVFGRMGPDDFMEACDILERTGLIAVIQKKSRRNPAEIPPENLPEISDREEKRREEESRIELPAEETSALIYVPLEECQPRKKREKKPKPELNCEILPELQGLKEILDGKKVSQLLQAKWLKSYHPSAIDRGIRKADAWATAKGRSQANWGLFFNNWLAREFKNQAPQFVAMGGNQTKQEPPPRKKSWWAEQNELQEKGLPNYLDGSLKDPQ